MRVHFPLVCPFFCASNTVPPYVPSFFSHGEWVAHSFVHLPYLIGSESSEASVLCGLLSEFAHLELDWFESPLVVFTHSYWVSHVFLLSTCFCEHLSALSLCFLCRPTHCLRLHVCRSCLRSCSCIFPAKASTAPSEPIPLHFIGILFWAILNVPLFQKHISG